MGWKRCSCEGNRSEAADILRSLIDRIELRPNQQGKLEIDLYGDLARILTLAGRKAKPLDQSDPSVHQVMVVAGARNTHTHRLPPFIVTLPSGRVRVG